MSKSEDKSVHQQRCAVEISSSKIHPQTFHEALLDAIPVAVFYKDIEGRYLGCNQLFCDILGVSKEQIIGKTVFDLWPIELAQIYHQKDLELFENPEHQRYEFQVKDFHEKTLEVIYTKGVFQNEQGAVEGLIGAFLDVTEAKENARKLDETVEKLLAANTKLSASYELLNKLSKNIEGVIYQFRMSSEGHFSMPYVSDKGYEFLGVTKQDLAHDATSAFDNVYSEDYEGLVESIYESARTMQPWEYEFRINPSPNVTKWLYGISNPEKCEDGSILWHGFLSDISDRKEAELKQQLAASVYSVISEGIVITDANGTIVDVNDAFTHITGFTRKDAIGQTTRILQSERHSSEFFECMWQTLIETGTWSGQVWNRHKNGEIFASLVTINAIRDSKGETQNYVALYKDITEIKEKEQELARMAHYDALTGLLNRTLLEDRIEQAIALSQRTKSSFAVAYIDLDGFKEINDNFGHDVGDELLISISQRIKNTLREVDALLRIGGDEFVAILTNLENQQDCEQILNRVLKAITSLAPITSVAKVSASIGVTIYPDIDADTNTLVQHADQAMYEAKRAGKNRLCFFKG